MIGTARLRYENVRHVTLGYLKQLIKERLKASAKGVLREAEQARSRQESEVAWNAALKEYVGNWIDFNQGRVGDPFADADDANDIAMDAAEDFFHQYPEWKKWAAELDMKKADMQSAIVDLVYEAIITDRVDF